MVERLRRSTEEFSEMFFVFQKLRKDVREYLARNLKPAEHYMEERIREKLHFNDNGLPSIANRWKEYEFHKKNLSKLCGFDSGSENCDTRMYDLAVSYLIMRMMI